MQYISSPNFIIIWREIFLKFAPRTRSFVVSLSLCLSRPDLRLTILTHISWKNPHRRFLAMSHDETAEHWRGIDEVQSQTGRSLSPHTIAVLPPALKKQSCSVQVSLLPVYALFPSLSPPLSLSLVMACFFLSPLRYNESWAFLHIWLQLHLEVPSISAQVMN